MSTQQEPRMEPGRCGEEWWIADELWRLAHAKPSNKGRFESVVVSMLVAGRPAPRRERL